MRALAAALSMRRRRARCSWLSTCGRQAGRGGLGHELPLEDIPNLTATSQQFKGVGGQARAAPAAPMRSTHRRPQVAEFVLLKVLPGVVRLVLPLKCVEAAGLLPRPAGKNGAGSRQQAVGGRRRRRRWQGACS